MIGPRHTAILAPLVMALVYWLPVSCDDGQTTEEGHWGEWGEMSPCTVTCGSGTQKKVRMWVPGPGEATQEEPFTFSQMFTCSIQSECPTDGQWSQWWSWSRCSKVCGGGTRTRERYCEGRSGQGKKCKGEGDSQEDCSREPCPPLPPAFNMSSCMAGQHFNCASGRMCIPTAKRCDDTVQCHDGTDEVDCEGPRVGRVRYGAVLGNGAACTAATSGFVGALLTSLLTLVALWVMH